MPNTFIAELFFTPVNEDLRFLPEGPRVLRNHPTCNGQLGWVAIQHAADRPEGSFNILDLATRRNRQFTLPGRPGFFAETVIPGVVIIGLDRRLILFDSLTPETGETLAELDCRDDVIINDGLAVEGGVLLGTKHLKFNEPVAALYFFNSATRHVHTVVDRQICSNGKFLKADGTLIDIDSTPKTISRYRLDSSLNRVGGASLVVAPDRLPALPDGLRPTAEGESVVVAFFNPGRTSDGVAQEIALDTGAVRSEWKIPGSPRVTCPELIEWNGQVKVLFTTAVEGMDEETRRAAPGAGCLYIADTPFHRVPASPPLVAIRSREVSVWASGG